MSYKDKMGLDRYAQLFDSGSTTSPSLTAIANFKMNKAKLKKEASIPNGVEGKYTVYILRTSSNTLYIGQTSNLEKRIQEHKNKSSKSAKYIRYFDAFELVYSEEYPTRIKAMHREIQLKKLTRAKKENLIKGVCPLDTKEI